ncbi:MAG TPA: gamma-glutamylcyclotransferase family protein, partial [Acidimicrobiia bacterium]|nr:gamma-glutamylcyclotransferase family protein [Acidimicrobiia bacterium]
SLDGSAKLNIRPDPGGVVAGVLYRVEDRERTALDRAEPRYTPIVVDVGGETALTYTYEEAPTNSAPYDWYVAIARLGAASHGLAGEGLGRIRCQIHSHQVCGRRRWMTRPWSSRFSPRASLRAPTVTTSTQATTHGGFITTTLAITTTSRPGFRTTQGSDRRLDSAP